MLPHSVLIEGRALRALGDGTIQTLRLGVWVNVENCVDFNAARDRVIAAQAANLRAIKAAS